MSGIVMLDAAMKDLVDPDVAIEKLASGFTFTEGPVWDYRNDRLLFSDWRESIIYEWREGHGHRPFREDTGGANGNTLDREGRLISCEAVARQLTRMDLDGETEVLASHIDGKRLNALNDVDVAPDGSIYFTDSQYGLRRNEDGSFADRELDFWGVYRYNPADGKLTLLTDDLKSPNGIAVSPDGRQLYVADSAEHTILLYDIKADGVTGGRIFCHVQHGDLFGLPDGIKLDVRGNLYVTANRNEGIFVFNPNGELLGLIDVDDPPGNLAWGGTEWQTLYVCGRTSLYRLPMKVAGPPVGQA